MNVLPRPSRAVEPNLAAEESRDLAADRQAESGAAVFAARAAIGLLERLEDGVLLVGRNADAAVADRKGEHGIGAIERSVLHAPAARRRLDSAG